MAGRAPARSHERQRVSTRREMSPPGLPLALDGAGSLNSNAPAAAVTVRSPARISPGAAACSSRAATLTASPVTNELPSRGRPTTTSPVLTPIRTANRSPNSSPSGAPWRLPRAARAQRGPRVRPAPRRRPSPRRRRTSRRASAALDLLGHRVVEAVRRGGSAPGPPRRRAPEPTRSAEQDGGELALLARGRLDVGHGGIVVPHVSAGNAWLRPAGRSPVVRRRG